LRTLSIGQDAAVQLAAENGGSNQEPSTDGAKFSEVLKDLIGMQGSAGIDMNPLSFAPAPVGTEVQMKQPVDEEREAEVEEDYLDEDTQEEQQVVAKEEVAVEEVVVEEASEEEFLQAVEAETERMVQEVVEKESTAGQGTPEIQTEQVATDSIVERQERMIGSDSQEGQNNQAWTPKQEVIGSERQKVDMSVPKELEQQVAALQDGALKETAGKVGPEVKTEAQLKQLFQGSTREVGSEEGDTPEPVFNTPVVNGALQQAALPKGSDAEQSLRFQLGSLLRPENLADKVFQQGSIRTGGGLLAGNANAISSSGEKGKLAAESGKTKAKPQQLPKGEQDKVVEQVKQLLKDANASRNGNTMVVRLDPPRLGAMMVRVTHKAGQVYARIIPESQEVETALRSRVSELTHALSAIGIKAENIHVSLGQERSESEMYQFNEFLNQQGSQGSEERGFSGNREEGHASIQDNVATIGNRGGAAEAGWVA